MHNLLHDRLTVNVQFPKYTRIQDIIYFKIFLNSFLHKSNIFGLVMVWKGGGVGGVRPQAELDDGWGGVGTRNLQGFPLLLL